MNPDNSGDIKILNYGSKMSIVFHSWLRMKECQVEGKRIDGKEGGLPIGLWVGKKRVSICLYKL